MDNEYIRIKQPSDNPPVAYQIFDLPPGQVFKVLKRTSISVTIMLRGHFTTIPSRCCEHAEADS